MYPYPTVQCFLIHWTHKNGTGTPGRCLHPCVLYLMSMKVGYFFSGIRIKIREIVFNLLEHTKICFDFSDDRFFFFSVFFSVVGSGVVQFYKNVAVDF